MIVNYFIFSYPFQRWHLALFPLNSGDHYSSTSYVNWELPQFILSILIIACAKRSVSNPEALRTKQGVPVARHVKMLSLSLHLYL